MRYYSRTFKYLQSNLFEALPLFYDSSTSLVAQMVKNLPVKAGDQGSIPGLGRSPEGNGIPFQYSCLAVSQTEEPGGLQSMGLQRIGRN